MKTSKLTFSIQEIPEGRSTRSVPVEGGEIEFPEDDELKEAAVDIEFYKTDHFIQVKFDVRAVTILLCDRSLKQFEKNVEGSYTVLFEPNPVDQPDTDKTAVREISGEHLTVDISREVRDTIMLNLPSRKIHPDYLDEDGKPVEFETKEFGAVEDQEEQIDPRWSELKKLKEKINN